MSEPLLVTYLQDHYAGSVAGSAAFHRVAEFHGDPDVKRALEPLAAKIDEDQQFLEQIMKSVDATPSAIKDATARVGEFAERLKPNERLGGRSPLSDVEDLEMLVIAVFGKRLGWQALLRLDDPRLDRALLEQLLERADEQGEELEQLRLTQVHKLQAH